MIVAQTGSSILLPIIIPVNKLLNQVNNYKNQKKRDKIC